MSTNVSDIANNILSSIDIPYSINIKVFKEGKKSDKPIPTFDISILHKITGVVQNYSQFSGGESYWIDLTLRLAYMIISLYKKDSKMSFMIFDEGIGRLDQANRDKFIELLKYTISTYSISQIFLVSHTDLSYRLSHFDDVITIRKDMDISRIQC
jgi:DNA repair exonuclease SbcCD ATPase subunit